MSSADILLSIAAFMAGSFILAVALGKWLKRRREADEETTPWPEMSLSDPHVRERMRLLLERYHIAGSCDIRDGRVIAALEPGRRDAMSAALMTIYRIHMEKNGGNANMGLCIPKRDGGFEPLCIGLDDIRVIAEMLEKKS